METSVSSAAPTQMRMFVRRPAGFPAISRSRPIAPPRSTASASLPRRSIRSALTTSEMLGGATRARRRMGYSRPSRLAMLARVEVADVVGRGLRRVVAQRHAAGLFLELRDSRLVGLSGGAELPEDRSAATLALNGWRNGLIVEVLVTARETHQRHKTNWTGSLHDILAVGEGIRCKSYASRAGCAR